MNDFKFRSVGFRLFGGDLFDFRNQVVSFRISQRNVHAETGHQADNTLRNGQRLAVRRGISPCHGQFFAFQVFQSAEMFFQPRQIGHGLRRVVNVALQVDHCRTVRQNAFFISHIQRFGDFDLIGVAGAQIHVVADTDDFGAKRNHVGRFLNRFTVRDLRFRFVQILHAQPQKVAGRSKGKARARRIIAENGNSQTCFKDF